MDMPRWTTPRRLSLALLLTCASAGACSPESNSSDALTGASGRSTVAGAAAAGASASSTATTTLPPPATSPAGNNGALAGSRAPAMPMTPSLNSQAPAGSGAMMAATPPGAPAAAGVPAGPGQPNAQMQPPPTAAGAPTPATPAGPDDGDPSKPVVSIPEVACKSGGGGFGLSSPNFKMDDRDVILTYPCDKHEGAQMTFILNLHGTTPVEAHFYQEGYFSAYRYAASHNLIIATPSSVVEQWGNGDNGEDLPYLMHIIDFVYDKLGSKFDIRSMWVGGHSWGAFYTAQFGCKPELADKVRGLIIMSGSPMMPACAGTMSVIDTNAEMDIGPPLEQGNVPMQHGCGAPAMMMLDNNTQTLWPDCDPGFVHSNYLMLGKGHIDSMDDVVVKSIVDLIKSARP